MFTGYLLYDNFKPLPITQDCLGAGFEAGIYENNEQYCYKGCKNNYVESCEERWLL